jgi:S-adenosylmethionine:tRNA ribosyltransferase-isomerase
MQDDLMLQAYEYHLPEKNIAQHPAERRDQSRLLVLDQKSGSVQHLLFSAVVSLFRSGDVLVINDTKVFPARLSGRKETGGRVEVFLLGYPIPIAEERSQSGHRQFSCEALIKSSRRPAAGSTLIINEHCHCRLLEYRSRGKWSVTLSTAPGFELDDILAASGDIPLPPYISRVHGTTEEDAARYQTVYANQVGAVAAPTAGLHFTKALLGDLRSAGVEIAPLTLHVGYGTFSPVEEPEISRHTIHAEHIDISPGSADTINRVKSAGGKVWAVGTTSVRALEFTADENGRVSPFNGWCDLYITPGFKYRVIDNLITNFHLPRSSLMFLVAALCGREKLLECYHLAVSLDYRFYSYGDAMTIIS